jgi:hypothetical protein
MGGINFYCKYWMLEVFQEEKNGDGGEFSKLCAIAYCLFNFLGNSAIDLAINLGAATIFFSRSFVMIFHHSAWYKISSTESGMIEFHSVG